MCSITPSTLMKVELMIFLMALLRWAARRSMDDHRTASLPSRTTNSPGTEPRRTQGQARGAGTGRLDRPEPEGGGRGDAVEELLALPGDDREVQQAVDVNQARVVQAAGELPTAMDLQLAARCLPQAADRAHYIAANEGGVLPQVLVAGRGGDDMFGIGVQRRRDGVGRSVTSDQYVRIIW